MSIVVVRSSATQGGNCGPAVVYYIMGTDRRPYNNNVGWRERNA